MVKAGPVRKYQETVLTWLLSDVTVCGVNQRIAVYRSDMVTGAGPFEFPGMFYPLDNPDGVSFYIAQAGVEVVLIQRAGKEPSLKQSTPCS